MGLDTQQSLEQNGKPFLADLLLNGTPSSSELPAVLERMDLISAFANTRLDPESVRRGYLALTFDTLEHSHLFVLALWAQGNRQDYWVMGPDEEFFKENLFDHSRVDGNQLNYTETRQDKRITGELLLMYPEDYEPRQKDQLTRIVTTVVHDSMPHLTEDLGELKFTY